VVKVGLDERGHWYRAVDSIFEPIFRGFYYRNNKKMVIGKLVERISKIDPAFLSSLGYSE